LISPNVGFSQQTLWDFDGQVSLFGSYTPDLTSSIQVGARYIPELSFKHNFDSIQSSRKLEGKLSLNMYGANAIDPWENIDWTGDINPYRAWLRYSTPQAEIRGGLQKIDFGSAAALRPLQWFNQIDPRDPLQITNGVYGVLGRYFFLNNTNIWVWGLYGNKERRGLDIFESEKKTPEYGGRIQFPVPKGEIAFAFHHRQADVSTIPLPVKDRASENRIGFDAKWDVEIGIWLEASYTFLDIPIDVFQHQFFATIGTDYTFGIGNGLNVILEHMIYNYSERAFSFDAPGNYSASIISYPISLDDRLSSVIYYNWEEKDLSFFINYQHQFSQITGYLMAFYIPAGQTNIQQSEWVNAFSGPGLRIMFVYSH
jgi:hypothetical protein